MEEMTREQLIQLVESLQKDLKKAKDSEDYFYKKGLKYQSQYNLLRDTLSNIIKMTENE